MQSALTLLAGQHKEHTAWKKLAAEIDKGSLPWPGMCRQSSGSDVLEIYFMLCAGFNLDQRLRNPCTRDGKFLN